jgi:hypothetical protein
MDSFTELLHSCLYCRRYVVKADSCSEREKYRAATEASDFKNCHNRGWLDIPRCFADVRRLNPEANKQLPYPVVYAVALNRASATCNQSIIGDQRRAVALTRARWPCMPRRNDSLRPQDADAEHDGHVRTLKMPVRSGPSPTFMKSITTIPYAIRSRRLDALPATKNATPTRGRTTSLRSAFSARIQPPSLTLRRPKA